MGFPMARETLAAQIDSQILAGILTLAREEGQQVELLVEEALSDLIEKHKQARTRPHVIAAYQASHERFATLYKKLAE
jgi:hypothetical protein